MVFKKTTYATFALLLLVLSGCSSWTNGFSLNAFSRSQPKPDHFSFAWQLSGDRLVGPLQVFDNGHKTWLQFAPEQAIPAIFAQSESGDLPVSYKRSAPYIVLDGVWPHLRFQGGHSEAWARQLPADDIQQKADINIRASSSEPSTLSQEPQSSLPDVGTVKPESMSDVAQFTQQSFGIPPAVAEPVVALSGSPLALPSSESLFSVSTADRNIRLALNRWAQTAGWIFQAEHWAVDVDIPITGEATFGSDFIEAVQDLVATTEMAERPLQPCFYSNRVLRVIPYAQLCDRSGKQEPV